MTTDLDHLEKLHREATGGSKWVTAECEGGTSQVYSPSVGPCRVVVSIAETRPCDARYIAAAHNAMPALIAELRALREVVAVIDRDGGHAQAASTPEQTQARAEAAVYALKAVAAAGRTVDKQDWDTLLEDCDPEAHPEEAADALNNLRAALAKVPR